MYETQVEVKKMGEGTSASGDAGLIDRVRNAILKCDCFKEIRETVPGGGSEDATWMMRRVQEGGGQAVYMALGADIAAPHHNGRFDLDESCMILGVKALDAIVDELIR